MVLPYLVIIRVILLSMPMSIFLEVVIVTPSTSGGDGSGGSGSTRPGTGPGGIQVATLPVSSPGGDGN